MLSKSEIKLIRSLSQKKFRDEEGLFVAEGEKLVEEAVKSDFEIVKIYRSDEIGEEAMSRITLLNSPSPILALLKKPDTPKNSEINRLVAPKMLAIGLDGIRDPGNAGTIIRIADWFGIDSIFASEDTVDIFNPKVVQSTMGAIFRIKFIYCDLQNIARTFVSHKMPIYGTFLEGEVIYDTELLSYGLIIMGSESNGISKEIKPLVTQKLFIPPTSNGKPTSESLNVAAATAIVCSEFRRQGSKS